MEVLFIQSRTTYYPEVPLQGALIHLQAQFVNSGTPVIWPAVKNNGELYNTGYF